jgi:hypothetical protein
MDSKRSTCDKIINKCQSETKLEEEIKNLDFNG